MKSNQFASPYAQHPGQGRALMRLRLRRRPLTWAVWRALMTLAMLAVLASCSLQTKPEQQPSQVAPACNQREPARDSAPTPAGADRFDWRAWAQAYVASQWAIVDRDNKRRATADCLDEVAKVRK